MKNITNRININDVVNETIYQFSTIQFICTIEDRCKDVGLNISELSNLTGVRYASLIDLKNGKKATLNLQHILAVMVALRLKSLDELFQIVIEDPEENERFDIESSYYRLNGLPDSQLKKIKINKERLGR